jgi:hypothetical protein
MKAVIGRYFETDMVAMDCKVIRTDGRSTIITDPNGTIMSVKTSDVQVDGVPLKG